MRPGLAAFLHDTRGWIRAKTGNPEARTTMAFREGEGAADVASYLVWIAKQ